MSIYLENAKREIAKADARAGKYKGPCSQCDWKRSGVIRPWCAHPSVEVAAFNAEAGYDAERLKECQSQRATESVWGAVVCGPDGDLFTPRRGFFEKLFGA